MLIPATHFYLQITSSFGPRLKLPTIDSLGSPINIHDFNGRGAGDLSYYSHLRAHEHEYLGWLVKSPSSFFLLLFFIYPHFFNVCSADHGVHFACPWNPYDRRSSRLLAYWRDSPGIMGFRRIVERRNSGDIGVEISFVISSCFSTILSAKT